MAADVYRRHDHIHRKARWERGILYIAGSHSLVESSVNASVGAVDDDDDDDDASTVKTVVASSTHWPAGVGPKRAL